VSVLASHAITNVTCVASTIDTACYVRACSLGIAIVTIICALISVLASHTVTVVAMFATTSETTWSVRALGVGMAIVAS
jgi:hypothetical protein